MFLCAAKAAMCELYSAALNAMRDIKQEHVRYAVHADDP